MKKISIIIFDDFTDIDLFLMWDVLGRNKQDWKVKILGTKLYHKSSNGLNIPTHGYIEEANNADVVLFASGKGTREVIQDQEFLTAFTLNPKRQLIGSICSGALILAALGLLIDKKATTHPRAKQQLISMGIDVVDKPFVCNGNIATAGGCLSAQYLVGWVIDKLCGTEKKKAALQEIFPVGQIELYENLLNTTIHDGHESYDK